MVSAIKTGLATTLSNGKEGVSSFLGRRPAVYPDTPATLVDQLHAEDHDKAVGTI